MRFNDKIEKIHFKNTTLIKAYKIEVDEISIFETNISLKPINHLALPNTSFEIIFSKKIIAYRSFDYQWKKVTKNSIQILNEHSPKIIVFDDYTYMLSSKNIGAWEIINENRLLWVLKSPELHPIFHYEKDSKRSFITTFLPEPYSLKLLFSKKPVPEFSRSLIPFKSIVCFTDHCDFDNNNNLNTQFNFFNKHDIKISKGFFLNHYSKRKHTTSYENDKQILLQFNNQGHELFYHSLSQSVKDESEAIKEFINFTPPEEFPVNTYIDHGYQPYNHTLKKSSTLSVDKWSKLMTEKKIKNFWTYFDTGTSETGIINQLNPNHFTPKRLLRYHYLNPIFVFRTLLFFSGDENLLVTYKKSSRMIKRIIRKKSFKKTTGLITNVMKCLGYVISTLAKKDSRNKSFKYAKYSPFIFQHSFNDTIFNYFQTTEVTNFENTFSKKNIDLLVQESGAIIAHCYFSSPLEYQKGKLFEGHQISKRNDENFLYLNSKIKKNEIWNPTISELINYTQKTAEIEFYMSEDTIKVNNKIPIRYIEYV